MTATKPIDAGVRLVCNDDELRTTFLLLGGSMQTQPVGSLTPFLNLMAKVPGTPSMKREVPGTPSVKREVPGTPSVKREVPGTPSMKRRVPGTPSPKR